jgi:hypothetical protein
MLNVTLDSSLHTYRHKMLWKITLTLSQKWPHKLKHISSSKIITKIHLFLKKKKRIRVAPLFLVS